MTVACRLILCLSCLRLLLLLLLPAMLRWHSLGTFTLDGNSSILLRNDGTSGWVVADAISLSPITSASRQRP